MEGSNGFCFRLAEFEVPVPHQGRDTPWAVKNEFKVRRIGQGWSMSLDPLRESYGSGWKHLGKA